MQSAVYSTISVARKNAFCACARTRVLAMSVGDGFVTAAPAQRLVRHLFNVTLAGCMSRSR